MASLTQGAAVDGGPPISAETLGILEEMKHSAARRAGVSDFGPDAFLAPLALLLEEGLAKPNRDFWREECEIALIGRLIREAEWKRNPDYAGQKIVAPVVICGIPRTGTTALHKLMSVDPQFQGLDHWLTAWPKPRPPRDQWSSDPGFLHAVAILEKRFAGAPGMKISHDVIADEVDECLEVLRLDFVANRFPSMTALPRYDSWFQQQDELPLYERLADTLRLIGLKDERRWLLKNPGHFGHLDALFAVFPDARVIITHRDPVKSIPSLCSVVRNAQKLIDPASDLMQMGRREQAYWSQSKARNDKIRATDKAAQLFDVDHRQFHADPIGTVKAIYEHAGLTLLPDIEVLMREWLAQNPADKYGQHQYALADYGLTEDGIREALGNG